MRTYLMSLMLALTPALALAQTPSPPPAPATRLADLVAQLEAANPELAAARREVDASVARIQPAGAPPDPTLSAGYMSGFLRPPFFPSANTPDGLWQFGVTQEIPYPGKLAVRTRIASSAAERARWEVEARRVRLIAELKTAYVELARVDRTLSLLDRTKAVLEQTRAAAEARFRVGRGPQQDILRAQLEISMLIERATMLQRERASALSAVNAILARPADTSLESTLVLDAEAPPQDLLALQQLAADRNPLIRRDDRQIDTGQQALALARKEVLPDFGVTFVTQRKVGEMPWMYGLDVMVTVPLFWQRKQRPMVADAVAMLGAAQQMREATRVGSDAELVAAWAAMDTGRRLMTLYDDTILPQARLTLESSAASYQAGAVDFLTLLANVTSILTYDIAYEQQRAQYLQALARLEPLTGLILIR